MSGQSSKKRKQTKRRKRILRSSRETQDLEEVWPQFRVIRSVVPFVNAEEGPRVIRK